MERIDRKKNITNHFNFQYENVGIKNSLYMVNLYFFPRRQYSDSSNLVNYNLGHSKLVTSKSINSKLVNSNVVTSNLVNSKLDTSNLINSKSATSNVATNLANSKLVTSKLTNSKLVNSNVVTFPEQGCKEKRAEIYKKGFPAVFQDMSKMKDDEYFAITKSILKPLALVSLKQVSGIYMITNKVSKKIYIGMSTNLNKRFYNYLDIKRLKHDGSSRINKALIKYGFENFSITILEMPNTSDTKDRFIKRNSSYDTLKGYDNKARYLRSREDFYIKVFKPQYNIKRYLATRDVDFFKHKCKVKWEIPLKIKTLLDKCIDPKCLDHNLLFFVYNTTKHFYRFGASTPKGGVKADSTGWFEGKIQSPKGYEELNIGKVSIKKITVWYDLIDKDKLQEFYTEKEAGYVKNHLKSKIKALKRELKKEEVSKE